jgi:hypothetical protein
MTARISDIAVAALIAGFLSCGLASTASARGLTTGFLDGAFASADPARMDEAAAAGAGMVRVPVSWAGIAPRPPGDARDPSDRRYDWTAPDAAVAAAKTRGLRVLLSIDGIPEWAEQGKRPKRYAAGTSSPTHVRWEHLPQRWRAGITAALATCNC